MILIPFCYAFHYKTGFGCGEKVNDAVDILRSYADGKFISRFPEGTQKNGGKG